MASEIDDGKLIECIKNFPNIYDKNHGDYRNKQSKMNAWITIGQKLRVSGRLCEQRWIVLRNRYATELRRKKNKAKPNSRITWRYSEAISFLEEYILPRRSRGGRIIPNNRKNLAAQNIKSKSNFTPDLTSPINGIPPEALVTVELGPASPNSNNTNNNNANNTSSTMIRLRPIAPRPSFATLARLVKIGDNSASDSSTGTNSIQNGNTRNYQSQSSESKEKQEDDDEDILFGKSIGYTLRNIRNQKTKLEVKSEILSILAQYAE